MRDVDLEGIIAHIRELDKQFEGLPVNIRKFDNHAVVAVGFLVDNTLALRILLIFHLDSGGRLIFR